MTLWKNSLTLWKILKTVDYTVHGSKWTNHGAEGLNDKDYFESIIEISFLTTLIFDINGDINGDINKTSAKLDTFQYDPSKHCVISYDCKSLFTNVKVSRVISWVLNEIMKNPRNFFNESHNGKLLEPPSRSDLRKFLHAVLTDFNFFRSQIGVFRQKGGLGMGSSLSPILANLFVNMFSGHRYW